MQKILTVLLAVTTVVGAWMAFQYHDQLAAKDAQISTLTDERDRARAAEKAALAAADPLKENIERLTRERDRLQAQAKMQMPPDFPPGGQMPPPDAGKPNLGGLMAMFKSPGGKQMLRSQSASMVRTQYSDFVKRMKLSPQDAAVVMGLLADRQAALTSARMTSGGDTTELSAIESEFNDKLKAALGEEGFNQLNDYDKSVPERTAVSQFEDQFNSAGVPLNATQKEGLISLMQTQREQSPTDPLDPTKNDMSTILNSLKDDTTLSTWEQQQQDYQKRVLQAATQTLTPDQVNTLQQSLDEKYQREKAGLQMFKTTGTPPPPPPTK
jgi:hypothetical protein